MPKARPSGVEFWKKCVRNSLWLRARRAFVFTSKRFRPKPIIEHGRSGAPRSMMGLEHSRFFNLE
jgi:hypothetical protein